MSLMTRGILGLLANTLSATPGPMDLATMAFPFETDTVGGEVDTIQWLGHIPGFRERIDKKETARLIPQKLQVEIRNFDNSWSVPGTWVRNSKIGPVLPEKVAEWGRRRIDLMNQLVANRINAAETGICYTGKSFFATDHVIGKSGALSNDITFDCTDHTTPTIYELARAIQAGIAQFWTFKDDQNLPLYRPMKVVDVVVNVAMVADVAAAVDLDLIDTGAGAVNNPLKGLLRNQGITVGVKTKPMLAQSNTKIHLYVASDGAKPYLLGENPKEKRITELDETSDHFKKEDEFQFNGFWAGGSSFGEPLDAVLVTLN